jgi:hypothetical protein
MPGKIMHFKKGLFLDYPVRYLKREYRNSLMEGKHSVKERLGVKETSYIGK